MATKPCAVLICVVIAVAWCQDESPANPPAILVDQRAGEDEIPANAPAIFVDQRGGDDVSQIVEDKGEQPASELKAPAAQNNDANPAAAVEGTNVTLANETQTAEASNATTNETGPDVAYAKQELKESGFLSGIGQLWNNMTGKQGVVPDISLKTFPGTTCKTDSDCADIANSVCQNNKCLCKRPEYTNSVHSLDKCVRVPKELGDACEESQSCNLIVPASECLDETCKCPPLFVYADSACLVKQSLGARCSNTAQCLEIPQALCLQEVCACPEPLLPSPTSNRCLQPAEQRFQATCYEDIQCMQTFGDYGRCFNGACICNDGYHYNSTQCVPDRKLGSRCETKEDCAVSVTVEPTNQRTCLNNNCTCAKGYKSLKGEDSCVKGAAYQVHASIVWLICICISKFYF